MKKIKIWITSAGGLVGTYLTSYFSQSDKYYLVGSDVSEYIALYDKLDVFYKTPFNSDPAYYKAVERIVKEQDIDVIIPVSSHDMDLFTQKKIQKLIGTSKMLIMDHKIHMILHNKRSCNEYLNSIGICTPKLYLDQPQYPCIMKPNRSSGSKNVIILEGEEDYLYWRQKSEEFSLFEYLHGKEYTVDCLFDWNGSCVGYNARERIKVNGGGAVISTCVKEEKINDVIKKLEATKEIKGPVNFQYKKVGEDIIVFDFNTRLPSGGLPLSVKAGFQIPELIIDLALGKKVDIWNLDSRDIGLTMIRYYQESYINSNR